MTTPTTELGRRLIRWQLSHTAPVPLSIDHPVQVDLAAAADEIEALRASVKYWRERTVELQNEITNIRTYS